jgi:hypothetical protein
MFSNPFASVPNLSPSTACFSSQGPDAVPSEDYSRWPLGSAGFFVQGERPRTHSSKKKIMKTYTHSDSRLLNRTAQRNSEKLHRIDFQQRFYNRGLSTAQVLDMLYHQTPRFWELCQVVGKWVWIEFGQQQPRYITAQLAQLGFHWNRRRQVWQHPCGQFRTGIRQDPREKYSTFYPAD